jgi:biotin operon repressor
MVQQQVVSSSSSSSSSSAHLFIKSRFTTQTEIGERIGWTREQVKHYIAVLNTIGTEVLNLARGHQEGRVPENGTTVPSVGLGIPG